MNNMNRAKIKLLPIPCTNIYNYNRLTIMGDVISTILVFILF